ncbi:glycosaminoglycan xylosylkinase homolog [Condylostylus longicornis]|uniref:glycosaminoglycan xylosylkinase homolog n=1 Tax=Condylostylus longicornis TaxID=2530218 RepID=UPI00244DB9E6|nr:glycosaminoglycan xylosylkinase homolog [Condylostylus longicornis]
MTTSNKKYFYIGGVVGVALLAFLVHYWYTHRTDDDAKHKSLHALEHAVKHKLRHLHVDYLLRNPKFFMYRNKLLRNYKPQPYDDPTVIWDIVNWWPNENDIYPQYDSTMGQLLLTLKNETITKAKLTPKGTQLKLLLKLSSIQKVIFKPQHYNRDDIIEGPIYSGKDRHNSEIYSFYLGAVLDLRWTPIAVGRRINLEEIYKVADSTLKKYFILNEIENGETSNTNNDNNNNNNENDNDNNGDNDDTKKNINYCFYGTCHFCSEDEPVCGDENNMLEGAILFMIPGNIHKHKSPWQRTYKETTRAEWEDNMQFCKPLKSKMQLTLLLDLIDASIFDYLIQNGDRHHYETRDDRLILTDNAKGFGNPSKDVFDILAPLYQCCLIRKTTWDRLTVLSGGSLTDLIDRMTKNDDLYPLISEKHRKGIERRLLTIYAVVEHCMDLYGEDILRS